MLRIYGGGAALSKKHLSELMPLSDATVAARVGQLTSKHVLTYAPPVPDRHVFERPHAITPLGVAALAAIDAGTPLHLALESPATARRF